MCDTGALLRWQTAKHHYLTYPLHTPPKEHNRSHLTRKVRCTMQK